jgi:hypothetical protein
LTEDRPQHALHIHARLRISVERRLLLKFLGEEIDAQEAVLARVVGQADLDDLARPALEDDQVADADEVAGDGDCVEARHLAGGWVGWAGRVADLLAVTVADTTRARDFDVDFFAALVDYDVVTVVTVVVVMVVVVAVREGVQDLVGGAFYSAAEAVVVAFVVVVAHVTVVVLVGGGSAGDGTSALVLDVVGRAGAAAVFVLELVDLVAGFLVVDFLAAVDFDVDFGVFVVAGWVAVRQLSVSSAIRRARANAYRSSFTIRSVFS